MNIFYLKLEYLPKGASRKDLNVATKLAVPASTLFLKKLDPITFSSKSNKSDPSN